MYRVYKFSVLIILIVFFCISMAYPQSQWFWQNPLPQGKGLKDVSFFDSNIGISVGNSGTILRTEDGGETWEVLNSPEFYGYHFYGLTIVDANTAWAVGIVFLTGPSIIIKTTDSGLNWNLQYTNTGYGVNLFDVFFINSTTGWAVGGDFLNVTSVILKSTDGGSTWTNQSVPIVNLLTSVYFTDVNTGIIVGGTGDDNGVMLRTTNGGSNWINQSYGATADLYSVFFIGNTGWAVGGGGSPGGVQVASAIFKTSDGGNTWIDQSPGLICQMEQVFFLDNLNGWVVTLREKNNPGGKILHTTNGGNSWETQFTVPYGIKGLESIHFAGVDTAITVGQGGLIYRTTDGGNNWVEISSNVTFRELWSVSSIDKNIAFAVGDYGVALKTINAGSNWNLITITGIFYYTGVFFIDADTGWVVGNLGNTKAIFKTTDGGNSWNQQYSFPADMHAVYFINADRGWVAGRINSQNGGVFRTTNGGDTWSPNTVTLQIPYAVFFIDENIGWTVGYNNPGGGILKTTDGGSTWVEQYLSSILLTDVYFINEDLGWACGGGKLGAGGGIILKTTDGGNNWINIPYGSTIQFEEIVVSDANNVIAVGQGIMKTTNGGNTWTHEIAPYTNFRAISIIDENTFIAVGTEGKIVRGENIFIPVELTSFTAQVVSNNVKLNWTTATETNNQGFEIQRSEVRGQISDWEKIGYVPGYGTTTGPKTYSFTDNEVNSGTYSYRLKQIDFDGTFEYSEEVTVEVSAPTQFVLEQNYPNPFNPITTIKFSLPIKSIVTLKVFDVLGKEVDVLINNEEKTAGYHKIEFKADNISSGVYFYTLKVGGEGISKKMMIVK